MMLFQSVIIGIVKFAAWFQLQMPIPGSLFRFNPTVSYTRPTLTISQQTGQMDQFPQFSNKKIAIL